MRHAYLRLVHLHLLRRASTASDTHALICGAEASLLECGSISLSSWRSEHPLSPPRTQLAMQPPPLPHHCRRPARLQLRPLPGVPASTRCPPLLWSRPSLACGRMQMTRPAQRLTREGSIRGGNRSTRKVHQRGESTHQKVPSERAEPSTGLQSPQSN